MPPKRKSDGGAASTENGDASGSKKKKLTRTPSKRAAIPDVTTVDYSSEATTKDGQKWNLKFSSWNVNGVRAWVEKNGHSYITAEDPDIFCLQETKCSKDLIPEDTNIEGYHAYWLSGDKDGYSGTGLYSKQEPLSIAYGIDVEEHDKEGRVITAEYEKFYLVTAYVPNAGRGLPRLPYRSEKWDPDFREYLKKLDEKKPVVLCGDLNVAHKDIDLANPKTNKKTAGFTVQERQGFSDLLEAGFVDSFRELYPEEVKKYSYWTYMGNARSKNVGWRLDYFIVSEKLKSGICDSLMRTEVMGSDHCPVVLLINI